MDVDERRRQVLRDDPGCFDGTGHGHYARVSRNREGTQLHVFGTPVVGQGSFVGRVLFGKQGAPGG